MKLTQAEISELEDCVNTREDEGHNVSIARSALRKLEATQEEEDRVRESIESLIGEYCDSTLVSVNGSLEFSLEKARFIEYFGESKERGPQELANRLVLLFFGKSHL